MRLNTNIFLYYYNINMINKKIGIIHQTYGNNRFLEMELMFYDDIGKEIRNYIDDLSITFHNSSQEFILKVIDKYKYNFNKEFNVNIFNNISYLDTIKEQLHILKGKGITDLLFIQDDHFGINNNENIHKIKHIMDFYKQNNIKFLKLSNGIGKETEYRKCLEKVVFNNITFNKFSSLQYEYDRIKQNKSTNSSIWSYNDCTYLANIDLMLELFNRQNIPNDVWNLEINIKTYFDSNNIEHWCIEDGIFDTANIHGKNTIYWLSFEDNLKRFFGMKLDFYDKLQYFKSIF